MVLKVWSLGQQHQGTYELVKMQILWPHPKPTESDTLEWSRAMCDLTSPPGDSSTCSNVENSAKENRRAKLCVLGLRLKANKVQIFPLFSPDSST